MNIDEQHPAPAILICLDSSFFSTAFTRRRPQAGEASARSPPEVAGRRAVSSTPAMGKDWSEPASSLPGFVPTEA